MKFSKSYFLFRVKKKLTRELLSLFFPNAKMSSYNIPPKMLRNLSLTEDYKDHTKFGAFNHESLVDICIKKGICVNLMHLLRLENLQHLLMMI